MCDIDKDGVNDFVIAERTQAPALVWYRRTAPGWTKYVVEDQPLHIEAGSDSLDIDGDGDLDIWVAEMRLNNGNPDAKNMLLLGDGTGKFQTVSISEGIANHESRIADLDGDGDYDVLGKPYAWQTPRLDIWLNEGTE
ncbi:MAG: VCBS repeat-containing protein [Phycisphaerae bacterium]|nr:VCBS repeat-containing protein [Phycisphaerae bacterium]